VCTVPVMLTPSARTALIDCDSLQPSQPPATCR